MTNVFFTKDLKDLTDASTKFNNQQVVCLFISVNLLSHPDEASNIPSHWVVMTSPATISTPEAPRPSFGLQGMPPVPGPQAKSGKPIVSVQVFTWGGLRTIRMETDKFCSNFYGYVSSSV